MNQVETEPDQIEFGILETSPNIRDLTILVLASEKTLQSIRFAFQLGTLKSQVISFPADLLQLGLKILHPIDPSLPTSPSSEGIQSSLFHTGTSWT